MAARHDRKHSELVRTRIKTSQLARALQDNVLGRKRINKETGLEETEADFLSDGQIRCALGMLAKAVPDLARTELTGADGGPLEVNLRDPRPPKVA